MKKKSIDTESNPKNTSAPGMVLSPKDYGVNASQALLKGIPYIGEALHQFIFGPGAELRLRRIENTLHEIGERLEISGVVSTVDTEEYVSLLERLVPEIARATAEDSRERFRDLLFNAATIPAGSTEWRGVELAGELLSEIDAPGLAILAVLGRCPEAHLPTTNPVPNVQLVSRPVPQVVVGMFDFNNPGELQHTIGYDWPIVEECTHRLHEKRLITFSSVDARGGFGNIHLSTLGQLLVRWSLADPKQSV